MRIRVVNVITRLNVGGPAAILLGALDRLDPDAFDVTLVAGRSGEREGDLRDLRGGSRVQVVPIPSLQREISPAADIHAFASLVRVLRRLRPDIVHTHLAKAGLLGRLAARVAGVRAVVHTFHGNVFSGYFGLSTSAAFVTLERLLALTSTRVIALSEAQRADLERRRIARPPRLVVIPVGVDLTPFLSARPGTLRRELGIPSDVPLVGAVARLVPIKGIDVLLRAVRSVPRARFVIVGDGPLDAELRRLSAALDIGDRVSFLGFRPDVADVYADLDVVVVPSRNEGTPLALIEALASGRPAVASAVGGVPEVLGDSGVLVEPEDHDALARAVTALIEDEERRRALGRAARQRVVDRYDVAAYVSRISDLYRAIATAT